MATWMLVAGGVVLLVVSVDLLSTTLVTTSRAGPLTSRLAAAVSWLARRAARHPGSPLVRLAGPAVLVTTIGVWLVLLWFGWTLIFSADPTAVVSATTGEPADGWSRAYFAAFTTFTLGVGDYVPNGAPWQILTGLGAMSGLALATMAITYLVPVVTAVTARRTQANTIAGLGAGPQDIVVGGWRAGSFDHLDRRLPELADSIMLTAERHLSYPILHHFHSAAPEEDLGTQLFALDEAVTILLTAVPEAERPHPAALRSVRHATTQLLRHVGAGSRPDRDPGPVDLTPLRERGVPTVDDATFAARLTGFADHRRRLAAFAEVSLWHRERAVSR